MNAFFRLDLLLTKEIRDALESISVLCVAANGRVLTVGLTWDKSARHVTLMFTRTLRKVGYM